MKREDVVNVMYAANFTKSSIEVTLKEPDGLTFSFYRKGDGTISESYYSNISLFKLEITSCIYRKTVCYQKMNWECSIDMIESIVII